MSVLIFSGILFVFGVCLMIGSIIVEMIFDLHYSSMFSFNMLVIGLIIAFLSILGAIAPSYLVNKEKYSPNTTHIEYIYESF